MAENNEKSERRSKYGNKKLLIDGEKYDSRLEYRRHKQLQILEKAGAISGLERQVRFVLIEKREGRRAVSYVADFVYFENDHRVVEDCKSNATKTQAYRIKKKLMAEVHGIEIKEIMKEEIE
ncbi:MAG: DUF1064 domain-containing protein [Clostridia bacterium]|nr:DUF1064 domain-containing protein [Clostridia bacterium]